MAFIRVSAGQYGHVFVYQYPHDGKTVAAEQDRLPRISGKNGHVVSEGVLM